MSLLSVQPFEPNTQQEVLQPTSPSFTLHANRDAVATEAFSEFESLDFEPGPTIPAQAIDLADVTWFGQATSRFSESTATTATTAVLNSPTQGLGDFAHVSRPNSHFAVIPTRPPLRPTRSYQAEESFSYYDIVSPELDYKSMIVAMEEVTDKSSDRLSVVSGTNICFIALCALNFLCGYDRSCLATALSTISQELNVSVTQVFWVATSYLTSAALVQPISMRVGSSFGIKPVAIAGLTIWAIGSLASALVDSYVALITVRTISGLGAGAVGALTISAVHQLKAAQLMLFHERLLSISFWLGLATGPVIGGAFIQAGVWQYVFFVTFPACLIGIMVLLIFLRLRSHMGWSTVLRQIEFFHWLLLVIAIVPLVWSISSAGTVFPWNTWHTLLPLIAGGCCFVCWCFCASMTANPILPVSILRQPAALAACVGTVVHGIVVTAILFLIPLLGASMGAGAVSMGVTLLPLTLALAIGLLGGWHSSSFIHQGSELSGWALLTLCTGSMVLFDPSNVGIVSIVLGIFSGLALGILASTLSAIFQAAATTDDETIHAAPMQTFLTTLGNAMGVAIGSCVFLNRFELDALVHATESGSTMDAIQLFYTSLDTAQKAELTSSFFTAMRPVWITVCTLSGLAFIITIICFFIRRNVREKILPLQDAEIWCCD